MARGAKSAGAGSEAEQGAARRAEISRGRVGGGARRGARREVSRGRVGGGVRRGARREISRGRVGGSARRSVQQAARNQQG